jgi:hypothetical protein
LLNIAIEQPQALRFDSTIKHLRLLPPLFDCATAFPAEVRQLCSVDRLQSSPSHDHLKSARLTRFTEISGIAEHI